MPNGGPCAPPAPGVSCKERQTAPPPQKGMPRVAPRAFDDGDALAAELAGDRIRLEQNLTSYLQQVFSC